MTAAAVLLLVAAWLVLCWCRPFRPDGTQRIGSRTVHRLVHTVHEHWRNR